MIFELLNLIFVLKKIQRMTDIKVRKDCHIIEEFRGSAHKVGT